VHGALDRLNRLYERHGVDLGPLAPATTGTKKDFAGAIIVAPPSALADRWSRRFPDPVDCFASAGCGCGPGPDSGAWSCR
jgi:putative mRNA 3-end processing factor